MLVTCAESGKKEIQRFVAHLAIAATNWETKVVTLSLSNTAAHPGPSVVV